MIKKVLFTIVLGFTLLFTSSPLTSEALTLKKANLVDGSDDSIGIQATAVLSPSSQTILAGQSANFTINHPGRKGPFTGKLTMGNGDSVRIIATDDNTIAIPSHATVYPSKGTFYASAVIFDADGIGYYTNTVKVIVK